jgi:hypothetical protein
MGKRHRKKPVRMNMSREIKEDLLPRLKARYAKRGRVGRSRMLDELCQDYHYERKYAIKLLRGRLPAPSGRKKPGPEPKYAAVEPIVRTIWLAAEQPCGKRWLRRWNCGCRITSATTNGSTAGSANC